MIRQLYSVDGKDKHVYRVRRSKWRKLREKEQREKFKQLLLEQAVNTLQSQVEKKDCALASNTQV